MKIIHNLMARIGYLHHTDVDRMLRDLRNAAHATAQENRRLVYAGERLADQHLAMHRRMVDAEKGLAHSEEEVKHLKSILAEERQRAMSLVTQAVTRMSPPVTEAVVKPLKRKRVS